jgi:F-type H+-transporting ATPase subunit c
MAAAIAMLVALGAGFGICFATSKAVEAVARQPEAASKIQTVLLMGCALAESTVIFAFVIALILSMK